MPSLSALFAAAGLGLGALGAAGWHFQPGWRWAAPVPRPLWQQVDPELVRQQGFIGVVPFEALRHWHEFWLVPVIAFPLTGSLLGLLLGAALRSRGWRLVRVAPTGPGSVGLRGAAAASGFGLLMGGLAALGWHVEPDGVWSGGEFLPADVGYPLVGVLVGAAAPVLARRAGWHLARP